LIFSSIPTAFELGKVFLVTSVTFLCARMNFIQSRRVINTKLNTSKIDNAITLPDRSHFQSYPSMSRWVNFIYIFKDKSASQKNQE